MSSELDATGRGSRGIGTTLLSTIYGLSPNICKPDEDVHKSFIGGASWAQTPRAGNLAKAARTMARSPRLTLHKSLRKVRNVLFVSPWKSARTAKISAHVSSKTMED